MKLVHLMVVIVIGIGLKGTPIASSMTYQRSGTGFATTGLLTTLKHVVLMAEIVPSTELRVILIVSLITRAK